ncbi:MAG: hypothetical protein ACXWM7_00190 [Parachlamydiaceae bacterium]
MKYIDLKINAGITAGRDPESVEKEVRADQSAVKVIPLALKHLTAGKGKNVAIDTNEAEKDRKYVYYSPVGKIYNVSDSLQIKSMEYLQKENELKVEVQTAKDIENELTEALGPGVETNLALEMVEVDGLVRAPFAEGGNLDKAARNGILKFPDSVHIAGDVLNGISNLHSTGRVHKDLKNEQVLLFNVNGKLTARLSDWGKTTRLKIPDSSQMGSLKKWIKEKENSVHTGNARCAAPEGGASFSGEAYSAAVMMIGVLEGELLKGKGNPGEEGYVPPRDMLRQPEKWDDKAYKDIETASKRFGFEKFLVVNKDCPQTENTSLRGNIKIIGKEIRAMAGMPSASTLQKSEIEAHKYIDALVNELVGNPPSHLENEIREMGEVLKAMTRSKVGSDEDCRMSTAVANQKWQEIMAKIA